jgi:hypothetical protein
LASVPPVNQALSIERPVFTPICSLPIAFCLVHNYEYGRSFFILSSSVCLTKEAVLSLLVLLADLPVRRWLLLPLCFNIFPVPVTFSLLAAPLCVFILGI